MQMFHILFHHHDFSLEITNGLVTKAQTKVANEEGSFSSGGAFFSSPYSSMKEPSSLNCGPSP